MLPHTTVARALVAAALAACAGGCASYDLHVDAISRPEAGDHRQTSYTITNRNPAVPTDSLRYREATERLKTALSGHGLWETPDPAAAELVVELDYAIEPARVVYRQVEEPIYLPTASPYGAVAARQIFGTTTTRVPVVVTEKRLSVTCRENKSPSEDRPPRELWQVSASIEDTDSGLRESLPILAAEVMNEVGRNTAGTIARRLAAHDPAVAFINQGP
jgi:hypothetical protein